MLSHTTRVILVTTALLAAIGLGTLIPRTNAERTMKSIAPRETGAIRLRAGTREAYVDRLGRVWESDHSVVGGTILTTAQRIAGAVDQSIYQTARVGEFKYHIPLTAGVYELRLHFAESFYGDGNPNGGGEASRIFNVLVNGERVLQAFDILGDVPPNSADVRVFTDVRPTTDGYLDLAFEPLQDRPLLNAIEIEPGTPGRLRPVRMIASDREYHDGQGRLWQSDHGVIGGTVAPRTELVTNTMEPSLYRAERYGRFSYAIPLSPGRYQLKLYFAEAWFGRTQGGGGGGRGSRLFDVYANGSPLLRGFDVYDAAEGVYRAVERTFHGLEPNAQGKLELAFIPSRNYACLNALEVVPEPEH